MVWMFRIDFESIVLAGVDGLIQVDGFDGVDVSNLFRIYFESIVLAGVDGLIQVDGFDGVDVFESISNQLFRLVSMV
eukprot:scaffold2874_cov50-Cyclotella_meneghiniana.AAC.1